MNATPIDRSQCLRRLGLDDSAEAAAIRRAYRRLALEHHPDRNGGSKEAHRRFIEIGEAYRELMRQEVERLKALRRPANGDSCGNGDRHGLEAGGREPATRGG